MKPVLAAALLAASGAAVAADEPGLADETARINYSVGYQIGGDFKRQGVELDAESMVRGIADALAGTRPLLPPQQMQATLTELKQKIMVRQQLQKGEAAEQKRVAGREFMAQNARKPGVTTTVSGLQYRPLEAGSGAAPAPTDTVTVNYRGTQIDGKEFDSSYKRGAPATFRLDGVIKGWAEGLQLMREGGKAELVIPPDLGYGNRGPLADQTLVFEVELLSVGEPEPAKAAGD